MTYNEFKTLVRNMRNAQKKFFKTRNQDALVKSKEYEKQIDEELADQRKLF